MTSLLLRKSLPSMSMGFHAMFVARMTTALTYVWFIRFPHALRQGYLQKMMFRQLLFCFLESGLHQEKPFMGLSVTAGMPMPAPETRDLLMLRTWL
jgi:hypothetical protein